MPSTRELRQRIRSVGNTAKVTNAMQLIAASRLRKAQQRVSDGRAYVEGLGKMLAEVVVNLDTGAFSDQLPLLAKRPVKKASLLLITPDRGLAGALVGNLTRLTLDTMNSADFKYSVVAVGRKGERFTVRLGEHLEASFSVGDTPKVEDVLPITKHLMGEYISGAVDRVEIINARFVSTAVQHPVRRTLLPIEPAEDAGLGADTTTYEPSELQLLTQLLPRYFETQVFQALLDAVASEHSARMVAMKNATDNANELIDDLTLELNKARQSGITNELLDIIGGVAALG